MAHLVSIIFTLGLLAGLAALLERMFRANGAAIRTALFGNRQCDSSVEAALERIGICLRAGFPAGGHDALTSDLSRLLVRISSANSRG